MNVEILFLVLVSVLTIVFLVIKNVRPIIELKIKNYHEIELKEIELQLTEIELRKLKVQKEPINLDEARIDNETIKEIFKDINIRQFRIEEEINTLKRDSFTCDSKIDDTREEIMDIYDRIEKLELSVFNGISDPVVNFNQEKGRNITEYYEDLDEKDGVIPNLDDLDTE